VGVVVVEMFLGWGSNLCLLPHPLPTLVNDVRFSPLIPGNKCSVGSSLSELLPMPPPLACAKGGAPANILYRLENPPFRRALFNERGLSVLPRVGKGLTALLSRVVGVVE
jgi:hypothetical protein